jgi:hypothetical protein
MLLHLVDRRQARLMLRGRLLVIAVSQNPQPALTNDASLVHCDHLSSDFFILVVKCNQYLTPIESDENPQRSITGHSNQSIHEHSDQSPRAVNTINTHR